VVLLDRAQGLAEADVEANRFGKFYSLIAELVDATAYVVVRFPSADRWLEEGADDLAFGCRWSQWPSWWSDERERLQKAAFIDYLSDAELALRRRFVRDRQ
jgi:hypothetical protein